MHFTGMHLTAWIRPRSRHSPLFYNSSVHTCTILPCKAEYDTCLFYLPTFRSKPNRRPTASKSLSYRLLSHLYPPLALTHNLEPPAPKRSRQIPAAPPIARAAARRAQEAPTSCSRLAKPGILPQPAIDPNHQTAFKTWCETRPETHAHHCPTRKQ